MTMLARRAIFILFVTALLSVAWTIAEAQPSERPSASTILDSLEKNRSPDHVAETLESVTRVDALALIPELIAALKDDASARRAAARTVLENLSAKLKYDQDALISLLASKDFHTRDFARNALVSIGPEANQALINRIEDSSEDRSTRRWATYAVVDGGELSEDQRNTLISVLNRSEADRDMNFWIAVALANVGDKSETICAALYYYSKSVNSYYRSTAARSLEKMGDLSKTFSDSIFETLVEESNRRYPDALARYHSRYAVIRSREANANVTYQEESEDLGVRTELLHSAQTRSALLRIAASHGGHGPELISMAIQSFGEKPVTEAGSLRVIDFGESYYNTGFSVLPAFKFFGESAVPRLLEAYKTIPDDRVLTNVIVALGNVGEPSKKALPFLLSIVDNPKKDYAIRARTVTALGRIGSAAPEVVIPKLVAIHKSRALNLDVPAAGALETIAERLADLKSTEFVGLLKQAQNELERNDREEVTKSAAEVRRAWETLNGLWWREFLQNRVFAYGKYPAPFLLLLLFWLALYFWRPIYLFKINQRLSRLPIDYRAFGVVSAPLRYVLLVGFFRNRPRVLDAWIKIHIDTARMRFSNRNTVKERAHHVPIPVDLDGKKITNFSAADLRPFFGPTTCSLMIEGEGGTGKTSLACLIAKWAMDDDDQNRLCRHVLVPILIEQDSEGSSDGNIIERAIQLQLKSYTHEAEFPTSELIYDLLKTKRLLIIVDGFSEIDATTRTRLLSDLTTLPVNALVFTSRQSEYLEDYAPTVIQPLKIGGNFLSDFLGTYFSEKGVRSQFDDEEFFDICRRMSLLSNNRDVTTLLVKLFADLVVAAKLQTTKEDLPQHLPDLVLYYLNYLNRDFDENETSNEHVHQTAKIIGWLCLRDTFHPTSALTKDVVRQLGGDEKAARHLDHLEHKLKLVRRIGVSRERVRFSLEPLAEYLAAMHLAENLGRDTTAWKAFLPTLKSSELTSEDRTGFIHALQDCCSTKYARQVPPGVGEELAVLSGIGLDIVRKENAQRRVRQIVQDLKFLDIESLSVIRQQVSLQQRVDS